MNTLVSRPTGWLREELRAIGNVISRGFERFVEVRQANVNAYVQVYLARLSEAELAELGYSGPEIAKIKESEGKELPYHL